MLAVECIEQEGEWLRYKGVVKYHASVKYPYTVLVSGLVPNHTTFPTFYKCCQTNYPMANKIKKEKEKTNKQTKIFLLSVSVLSAVSTIY